VAVDGVLGEERAGAVDAEGVADAVHGGDDHAGDVVLSC
jgi:hypothetical protein